MSLEVKELGEWLLCRYDELESTNDEALRLSAEVAANDKIIVTARRQTRGRGRRGRSWLGSEGNLFMSQLFRWPVLDNGALVLIVGLSLLYAIKELCPESDVKLKWPNDVLLGRRKVSGILLERADNEMIIVGVGVNIVDFPQGAEILYPAISLIEAGIRTDCECFIKIYIQQFARMMQIFEQSGIAKISEMWQDNAEGVGQEIVVKMPNAEKKGIFCGINNQGMLQLQTSLGKIEVISSGDVFFVRE